MLQTSLYDFHIGYELNASDQNETRYRETRSDLLGALQDEFASTVKAQP